MTLFVYNYIEENLTKSRIFLSQLLSHKLLLNIYIYKYLLLSADTDAYVFEDKL